VLVEPDTLSIHPEAIIDHGRNFASISTWSGLKSYGNWNTSGPR